MPRRKETIARERHELLGDQLASLAMRLYIAGTRYDERGGKSDLDVKDFSSGTWSRVSAGLLRHGWQPPPGWEGTSHPRDYSTMMHGEGEGI